MAIYSGHPQVIQGISYTKHGQTVTVMSYKIDLTPPLVNFEIVVCLII